MTQPEKKIENNIIDWLNTLPGCFAFKYHVGGKRGQIRTKGNRYTPNGMPDVLGVYHGQFFAIEVKFGNGKPSKEQCEMMNMLEAKGAFVFWSNNFQECQNKFKNHFGIGKISDSNDVVIGQKILF